MIVSVLKLMSPRTLRMVYSELNLYVFDVKLLSVGTVKSTPATTKPLQRNAIALPRCAPATAADPLSALTASIALGSAPSVFAADESIMPTVPDASQ